VASTCNSAVPQLRQCVRRGRADRASKSSTTDSDGTMIERELLFAMSGPCVKDSGGCNGPAGQTSSPMMPFRIPENWSIWNIDPEEGHPHPMAEGMEMEHDPYQYTYAQTAQSSTTAFSHVGATLTQTVPRDHGSSSLLNAVIKWDDDGSTRLRHRWLQKL
jgi:hypothetical protein